MAPTFLPFLYQTRTLQIAARQAAVALSASVSTAIPSAGFHTGSPRLRSHIHAAPKPIPLDIYSKLNDANPTTAEEQLDHAVDFLSATTKGEDASVTITPSEEQIFRTIFQDLARRGRLAPNNVPNGHGGTSPNGVAPLSSAQQPHDEALAMWRAAGGKLASDEAGTGTGTGLGAQNTSTDAVSSHGGAQATHDTTEYLPEWLLKYPPALRKTARLAMSLRDSEETDYTTTEPYIKPILTRVHVRATNDHPSTVAPSKEQTADTTPDPRAPIRAEAEKRINGLIEECKTDMELWNMMEREIFPLVHRLGVSGSKSESKAANAATATANMEPSLDLGLHGHLYAIHLVQCLKALDTSFARSSPLALDVLPRVRSLGLGSFILGASTTFYNELISILWFRHGDAQAVLRLLKEMQYVGLRFTQHTRDVALEMVSTLDEMAEGARGPISQFLATTPGYNFDVLAELIELVNKMGPGRQDLYDEGEDED